MKEYNFFITIKYGFSKQLPELIWDFTIVSTDIEDEERMVESFRAFIRTVKNEKK